MLFFSNCLIFISNQQDYVIFIFKFYRKYLCSQTAKRVATYAIRYTFFIFPFLSFSFFLFSLFYSFFSSFNLSNFLDSAQFSQICSVFIFSAFLFLLQFCSFCTHLLHYFLLLSFVLFFFFFSFLLFLPASFCFCLRFLSSNCRHFTAYYFPSPSFLNILYILFTLFIIKHILSLYNFLDISFY